MGVPSAAEAFFQDTRTAAAAAERRLDASLRSFCATQHYLSTVRTKSLPSLSEKIETGRYESLAALEDLVAATIVVPTASHFPEVERFLETILTSTHWRGGPRRVTQAPDQFRFDANRIIGVSRIQEELDLPRGLDRLRVEVQIHTAFEYAWTMVTHDLVYKSETVDWRRLRLSAQLKATVEQVDLLIATFEQSAASIPERTHPGTECLAHIIAVFQQWIATGEIPSELKPDTWSRFAENVYSLVRSYTNRGDRVEVNVESLLTSLGESVRAETPPVSGSLFQVVLGHVARGKVEKGNVRNFRVLWSRELSDFYQLTTDSFPLRIVPDWP